MLLKYIQCSSHLLLTVLLFICTFACNCAYGDSGRGRHKQVYATPATGKVVIDGKLDDWDLSAQIEMFVVGITRAKQNAKFAMMYDDKALYIGASVKDTSPMMNRHDPHTNAGKAWDADACQFRMTVNPKAEYPLNESVFKYRADKSLIDKRDDIVHLTLWYYTDSKKPCLHMEKGMTYRAPRPEWANGLIPENNFEAAYYKYPDGTGYSFEYRIPWETLSELRPLKGGDVVAGTVQFNWSTPDGQTTAGEASWAYDVFAEPGFPYQNAACWGKIIFSEYNNVPRELVNVGIPPERDLPLEFSYKLPEDGECTIQLFNKDNESVRILVAQQQRSAGLNIEKWDGLDDNGNLLPPGEYIWKGITHKPIKAKYVLSVDNSGDPPYPTDDGKGGWGGDHGFPRAVCALDDGMLLAWDNCEYGWGIIRTDINGKKIWGSRHGASLMATDGKRIYIAGDRGFQKSPGVKMLAVKDSRPVMLENGVVKFAANSAVDDGKCGITGLAYHLNKLYVTIGNKNLLEVYSTIDGKLISSSTINKPGRMAVSSDNELILISDNTVVKLIDGKIQKLIDSELDQPYGITVDCNGKIFVSCHGKKHNVQVFDKYGKFLYEIGVDGGRPVKGKYNPAGMYMPGGIAIDRNNKLWVAEMADGPKRISVWDSKEGTNKKEFFGSAPYFGYGNIDPERPNEIYASHMLWEIDWNKKKASPMTTIWRKLSPDMMLPPGYSAYQGHPRLMTAANGKQYMWGGGAGRGRLSVLLRRDGDLFKPCAAMIHLVKQTDIALIDDNPKLFAPGYYFWQDANDDQSVQAEELTRLSNDFRKFNIVWVNRDLSIHFASGHFVKPVEIRENGQPVFDISQATRPGRQEEYFAKDADGVIYTFTPGRPRSLEARNPEGKLLWAYNNIATWRDSLSKPLGGPGNLNGMTGAMGVAGDFIAFQSYFGINHIICTNGVYAAAILKDARTGGRGPYEGQPEGQNGSFVKLRIDGKDRYFVIHGGQDCRIWEVENLDTVKKLPGGVYMHTEAIYAMAEKTDREYRAAIDGSGKLVIAKGKEHLDKSEPLRRSLGDGRAFSVRAAYDDENIYFRYDVRTPFQLTNNIADPKVIFQGGNLLDIQLATDPDADPERKKPACGDIRILVTQRNRKPYAVMFRPVVKDSKEQVIVLNSPTGQEKFDMIQEIDFLEMHYSATPEGFLATLVIPLDKVGLKLDKSRGLKLDLGYIFGNQKGSRAAARAYVFNNSFSANVIDDIPHESRLEPAEWGFAEIK
jgi:hypothetical protein